MKYKLAQTQLFAARPLESIFRTSKKTIQEYVKKIDRIADINLSNLR